MLKKVMMYAAMAVLGLGLGVAVMMWQFKDFANETKEMAEEAYFDERLDLDDLPVDMMETFQPENYLGCRMDLDETYDEFGVHHVVRSAYDVSEQTDDFKVIEFLTDPDTEKIIGWEVFNYVPTSVYSTSSNR